LEFSYILYTFTYRFTLTPNKMDKKPLVLDSTNCNFLKIVNDRMRGSMIRGMKKKKQPKYEEEDDDE
jgi:hypothetical protein